jgi:hypothetical protein
MQGHIYDIEVYPNGFWASFIPVTASKEALQKYIDADIDKKIWEKESALIELGVIVFGIFGERNDLKELVAFLHEVPLLIGYNNKLYDNLIIDMLCIQYSKLSRSSTNEITSACYDLSQDIINAQGMNVRFVNPIFNKYKHPYISIDLMAVVFESIERKSLKQCAINLKWYRIQDLPYPFDQLLNPQQQAPIIDYNINDILITFTLYWHQIDIIKLRIELSNLYDVNLLNASKSKTADILLAKFYEDATGLKYYDFKNLKTYRSSIFFGKLIDDKIKFNHPQLQAFLTKLKGTVINTNGGQFSETLIFEGQAYTFATGGLHSKDRAGIMKSTKIHVLRDCDVSSYYPSIVAKLHVHPEHIDGNAFYNITVTIIKERLEAKHNKQMAKADGLKITLNSGVFGKFGYELGWLYDLDALYKVTLNGQLFLLMLIEQFEANDIHVFSANTDGIVVNLPLDKEEVYYKLCNDWCSYTDFELEYTDYSKYIYTSVNSYLAIKTNGKIKTKNDFVTDIQLNKGYNMPIVAIALNAYYIHGTPIDETLHNHTNIYDFCISQRIGGQFIAEYHELIKGNHSVIKLQKNIRYFVTTRGGTLMKKYKDSNKRISAVAGETVTIFNDYFRVNDMSEYNIKYNYYKKECDKIINAVANVITSKMKTRAGSLFDDFE